MSTHRTRHFSCSRAAAQGIVAVGLALGCCTGIGQAQSAPEAPPVIPRATWQARPPLSGMKPHDVRGIIIHHTGVRANPHLGIEVKMRGLQSFSQNRSEVSSGRIKNAWPDVPYHYYIDVTGKIPEGRSPAYAGDTNTGYNTFGYLQIVVEGDFERDLPTAGQLASLKQLIAFSLHFYRIPVESVKMHNQFAPTACPGRNLLREMPPLLSDNERDP